MLCTDLGPSVTPDACKVSMNNVKRIFYKLQSGDDSGIVGAISSSAYETAIQTEATWDTEIAKTNENALVGSPDIFSHDIPETLPAAATVEDGTTLGFDQPGRIITFKAYGLTSAHLEALRSSHQKPVKFFFVCQGGIARVNKYVDATTDVFFDAEVMSVSDIVQQVGSAVDYVVMQLSLEYGALDSFQDVTGCSFLISK